MIILAIHFVSAYCGNMSYVRKFYTDLFSNYAKKVMCVYDHLKPLMVGVTFYLASINNFKEVEETICITDAFNCNWTPIFNMEFISIWKCVLDCY